MNYNYIFKDGMKVPVKIWNKHVPMEQGVFDQTQMLATLPFLHKHIAMMPDAHVGKGSTVGSVIATRKAVIPAAVGVDIGCGMIAVRTTLTADDLPDDLKKVYDQICRDIPVGRGMHQKEETPVGCGLNQETNLMVGFHDLLELQPELQTYLKQDNVWKQLGTLGGGNHFIEICLDLDQRVWVMVHSGSRGIGNQIGTFFIEKAKKDMEQHFIQLPDQDLAYLTEGSKYYTQYLEAVDWAQNYAMANRQVMLQLLLKAMSRHLLEFTVTEEAINCHHNYISKETHFGNDDVLVTRKGAISAQRGQLGIIPGSMGAKSFIVRGLGNNESFCSCSHGAGRVMSRGAAKKLISLEQHKEDTKGIMCRKDEDVIDESPRAYKNIDDVMKSQDDLVEIVYTLKQILCVKG